MKQHTFISLYAATQAHKNEFESAIKQGLVNALESMSLADIKEAFTPGKGNKQQFKKAA